MTADSYVGGNVAEKKTRPSDVEEIDENDTEACFWQIIVITIPHIPGTGTDNFNETTPVTF